MTSRDLLSDAIAAPEKGSLSRHRAAILELRRKNYSWREVADFLVERGVETDHTKVYRFITKSKNSGGIVIPTAAQYEKALSTIEISDMQRKMLEAHYRAHNRSTTYTALAAAAGYDSHRTANRWYGQLGSDLGNALNFTFADANKRPGEKFYSSAIGMEDAYPQGAEFQLVMHHELADAIRAMKLFAN
jgi:hypothetical protein